MPARDAMELINEQDEATIERFAERLEYRGTDPTFTAYREAYLDAMELPDAAVVLELGCGTGVVARAIAAREGFGGRVVGIDQSPALVDAARRFAADAGLDHRVEFLVGDAHALGLPDASFDALLGHTLFSHVTDPAAVLAEAARVLRPGGLLAIFDGDYSSWTWACSDPALAREMEDSLRAVVASKPRVMHDLPALLRGAGLTLARSDPRVYAEVGQGRFFLSLADAYAPLVIREQHEAHEQGVFFAACNYYAYLGRL